jgi:Flp pilus assembly protein TadD
MSKRILTAILTLTLVACERRQVAVPQQQTSPTTVPTPPPTVLLVPLDAGPLDTLALVAKPGTDHAGTSAELEQTGDFQGALVEARRALSASADDEELLGRIAKLSLRAKQPLVGAEALGRLATLRPTDPQPLVRQARLLLKGHDASGAAMAAREAMGRDEGLVEAPHVLGLALLRVSELAGAAAAFERSLQLDNTQGWALNNLGYTYLLSNQPEKAVDALEEAAERLPTVAMVHNNLGLALERVGRTDEARGAFLHASDLSPKYVKALVNAQRLARAATEPQLPQMTSEPALDAP